MTDNAETGQNGGPLPGLLRPPIIFLAAILLGIALNRAWPLSFVPAILRFLGPVVVLGAGPYHFSRNPIYVSFVLLVLGLSVWLDDLWLLVTLVPAVGVIAAVVIPKEERFLERNFHDQYASYKAAVRRWL